MTITPKVNAMLSIPSSLFIIYECYCDFRRGRSRHNAIQRSLIGMSVIEIMDSSAWFMGSWLVPEGTFFLASGNQATCNFQGFLLQIAIGAPLYNCSLALYYLLMIKYNWTSEMLHKIEIWVHVFILTFAIGTSFALLPMGLYNQTGVVCWVIGKPPSCGNSSYQPSDVPCERGDFAYIYGMALFYGPLWVCVAACMTSMFLIYLEVRRTHRRIRRYSAGDSRQLQEVHSLRRSATDTTSVATQAILYSLSFVITWMPSTVWSICHWFNADAFFLDYASSFCEPLQGFWNLLIFLRRRPSSQEKIRVFVNSVVPFLCKEPNGRESTGSKTSDLRRRSSSNRRISSHHRHSSNNERASGAELTQDADASLSAAEKIRKDVAAGRYGLSEDFSSLHLRPEGAANDNGAKESPRTGVKFEALKEETIYLEDVEEIEVFGENDKPTLVNDVEDGNSPLPDHNNTSQDPQIADAAILVNGHGGAFKDETIIPNGEKESFHVSDNEQDSDPLTSSGRSSPVQKGSFHVNISSQASHELTSSGCSSPAQKLDEALGTALTVSTAEVSEEDGSGPPFLSLTPPDATDVANMVAVLNSPHFDADEESV